MRRHRMRRRTRKSRQPASQAASISRDEQQPRTAWTTNLDDNPGAAGVVTFASRTKDHRKIDRTPPLPLSADVLHTQAQLIIHCSAPRAERSLPPAAHPRAARHAIGAIGARADGTDASETAAMGGADVADRHANESRPFDQGRKRLSDGNARRRRLWRDTRDPDSARQ